MPKFTLFWITTYTLGLLASFVNPVFGTYTYLFEYYLRPGLHWWGRNGNLPPLRWNFIASFVSTLTFLLRRGGLRKIVNAPHGPGTFLLALGALMLFVTQIAVNRELSWEATSQYLKLILFHGLIVATIRSEAAFDGFIALHMAGAGWWGWEAYQNPSRDEGRLANIGSGDTLNDNFAASHLLTVIPFLLVYLFIHRDKKLKALALLVMPFAINTFILCNSRGGTVGLLLAVGFSFFAAKGAHRLRMVGASVALGVAFYLLADPEYISRQQTTTSAQDGSALQRLDSWRGGMRIVPDYPLGAGGSGFEELSPIYIPDVVGLHNGEKRAPHNTFVLTLTDWGIFGLALFLGFCGSVFYLTRQVRRRAQEGGIWYYRALALEASFVGLLVSGIFSDRLYGEAPYWIGGLAVTLHRLQSQRLLEKEEAAVNASAAEPAGTPASVADYVRVRWAGGATTQ